MKRIYLLFILGLGLMACEKNLELQPFDQLSEVSALEDASSIEACVNGIYLKAGWALYYNGYKNYGDFLGDFLKPVDIYPADPNYFRSEKRTGTWNLGWQCINAANMVIEAVDLGNAGVDANADRLKGEALFWRGTILFELTRQYGPQFDPSNLEEPAIMLYTRPVRDFKGGPLRSVEACYEQIIADLEEAAALLPADYTSASFPYSYTNTRNRVIRDAAWAMLARVSFQKGTPEGYTAAVMYADSVLGTVPGEITTSRKLAGTVKTLFQLQAAGSKGTNSEILVLLATTEYRGYNTGFPFSITANSIPSFAVNDSFHLYTSTPIDTQLIKNSPDSRVKGLYEIRKDRNTQDLYVLIRKYDISTLGFMNFPYLRSAEVLLTRAESRWQLGQYPEAFSDYKLLKSRSIPLAAAEVQGSNEALLDSIQQERVRELVLEGDRYWDLLRRRAWISGGVSQVAGFNWNDPHAKCQIPDQEIIKNPYLK